jgi:GxxExxY protein
MVHVAKDSERIFRMHRELPNHLRGMPEWDRAQRIIAAFYETYNVLGYGLFESVYREALAHELRLRGMTAKCEMPVQVSYKGQRVGTFRLDLVVEDH